MRPEDGWEQAVHPDDLGLLRGRWRQAVDASAPYEVEYRIRCHNGTYRWHLGRALPVRDVSGVLAGWFGTATDIDDQKLALAMRDAFLSIASHELKTPLTSLKLQVQTVLLRVQRGTILPPPEWLMRVRSIEEDVDRLDRLVDEMLDVARINEGRLEMHREQVDLSALVREVAGRFFGEMQRVGQPLVLHLDSTQFGQWDRTRIDQILTNLLSNAIKYGRAREVEITVTAAGEGWSALIVRDEGIGVATADQERIFERFERAVSDHQYGGFGLGLWICRQFVEAHGGRILLESEVGKGSTFTVLLPQRPLS